MAYHSKEEMLRDLNALGPDAWAQGVYFDVPKRRRASQAKTGQLRLDWPLEQKQRFIAVYDRFVEAATKDLAIEILLRRLESVTNEELFSETQDIIIDKKINDASRIP